MSLTFLRGQIGYMRERGISAHALSSPGEDLEAFGVRESVPVHAVPMTRRITPLRDVVATIRIAREIRRARPAIVHAHTPKGGLLGMLASILTRVRVRIYHMRGLPFVTAQGPRRSLLKWTERFSCRMAHTVICNSHSLRTLALEEGLCPAEKIKVLRSGSGNGVDAIGRFNPGTLSPGTREEARREHEIPPSAIVIGFVGRIVREKGIGELEEAWRSLRDDYPDAYLLLVGPFETQDPVPAFAMMRLQNDERVRMTGMDWNVTPLYAAMDLVVLPTYREGFPNVPLEAAAMELPVVATNVPGCVDSVEDGKTGALVPARDAHALARAMRKYLDDPELRKLHGRMGRERVLREFEPQAIWEAMHAEYMSLVDGHRRERAKRVFDMTAAAIGLLVTLPMIAVVALIVRLKLGRPVFFRQERPGYRGRPFTMIKFRTMREATDGNGNPLPDADRLSPMGEFLRRTSLDELPELWNVLRGEMSLVGPRPLLTEYLPLDDGVQMRRHDVLPGLTGWAQINGRNATTWEKRLALDVWYVDHRSFWLDMQILVRTLRKVLLREGISQEGVATMKRFHGTSA
jgi:lipopolysaccharide/colanic/teichoic acid biosynthesis glycosyltransferase